MVGGMARIEAASLHQLMQGMLEARGELGGVRMLGGRGALDSIRQVRAPGCAPPLPLPAPSSHSAATTVLLLVSQRCSWTPVQNPRHAGTTGGSHGVRPAQA